MKKVQGKFNFAIIFADTVDDVSIEQIKTLCDQEFVKDCAIRIMPDVHAGAGCTIGTTMTIKDKIVPNLVGVDIGCGMATFVLKEREIDLKKLDDFIYSFVPAGMNIRETPHGAGRLYSRTQTKKNFNVDDYKKAMDGIYTTSINDDTLDECPMAYKNMDEIVKNITPTAQIVKIIKPVYNFKAGETADFKRR